MMHKIPRTIQFVGITFTKHKNTFMKQMTMTFQLFLGKFTITLVQLHSHKEVDI